MKEQIKEDKGETYKWVKASDELPKVKGYYIIRRPTYDKKHWLIKEDTFNPSTNEEIRIEMWKKEEVEWLKPIQSAQEDKQANRLTALKILNKHFAKAARFEHLEDEQVKIVLDAMEEFRG